jgi:hypothetical protein
MKVQFKRSLVNNLESYKAGDVVVVEETKLPWNAAELDKHMKRGLITIIDPKPAKATRK